MEFQGKTTDRQMRSSSKFRTCAAVLVILAGVLAIIFTFYYHQEEHTKLEKYDNDPEDIVKRVGFRGLKSKLGLENMRHSSRVGRLRLSPNTDQQRGTRKRSLMTGRGHHTQDQHRTSEHGEGGFHTQDQPRTSDGDFKHSPIVGAEHKHSSMIGEEHRRPRVIQANGRHQHMGMIAGHPPSIHETRQSWKKQSHDDNVHVHRKFRDTPRSRPGTAMEKTPKYIQYPPQNAPRTGFHIGTLSKIKSKLKERLAFAKAKFRSSGYLRPGGYRRTKMGNRKMTNDNNTYRYRRPEMRDKLMNRSRTQLQGVRQMGGNDKTQPHMPSYKSNSQQ